MKRANVDDLPNPFSMPSGAATEKRAYLAGGLKYFLGIAALLVVSLLIRQQYTLFRLNQLASNVAELPSAEKQERLQQLSSWGRDAIPVIVATLADLEDRTANQAHRVLQKMQQDWTVLESDLRIQNQTALVDSIVEIQAKLSDQRRDLAIDLLQNAAQLSVDQQDTPTRQLYFAATAAIEKLSPPSKPATESDAGAQFSNIDVRHRPLPVEHLARGVDWTDWPPREAQSRKAQTREDQSAIVQAVHQTTRPKIHNTSAAPLQAVPDGEVVLLRDVHHSRMHSVEGVSPTEDVYQPPTTIQPVAHIIENPWQGVDVATIIRSLTTADRQRQDQAKTELVRRGYNDAEISIGMQIASGDVPSKITLIDSLAESVANVDSRPWLMLLLDDRNREVRLRAISALADLKDPWVQQQLRLRMVEEKDQTVAFRIRRLLNLR